jgi:hypothetical protein
MAMLFVSCSKDQLQATLNTNDDFSFSGTFEATDSEMISGTVALNIKHGYYECSTYLPYGQGAGKLESTETTLNFIDTLFLVIPAMFGPSFVLSGEHLYEFDGETLKIWRDKNVGGIEYDLKLTGK